jgi:hypothetical protein
MMMTWIRNPHLRAQFERLLGAADDRPDGGIEDVVRARLAADVAESLEDPAPTVSANVENDDEDPARTAAYLECWLTGSEREAYLVSLAANPRRSANLASAVALLSAIEAEPKTAPSELLARARSVFADRAVYDHRPILARRNRVIGWSLATLMLLIFVPGALVLVGGRIDWPLHSETHLRGLDASAPPPLAGGAPAILGPVPETFSLKAAPAPQHEPGDVARAVPELRSCDLAPAAGTVARSAGRDAENAVRSSSTAPCPPIKAEAEKARDAGGINLEKGAAAASQRAPIITPALPSTR